MRGTRQSEAVIMPWMEGFGNVYGASRMTVSIGGRI
jgi:hypothetical protein